jgi:hypothetical protein
MSQDTVRTTTTRRAFLSTTAPAIAAVALTGAATAAAERDPIFAMIERHRAVAEANAEAH